MTITTFEILGKDITYYYMLHNNILYNLLEVDNKHRSVYALGVREFINSLGCFPNSTKAWAKYFGHNNNAEVCYSLKSENPYMKYVNSIMGEGEDRREVDGLKILSDFLKIIHLDITFKLSDQKQVQLLLEKEKPTIFPSRTHVCTDDIFDEYKSSSTVTIKEHAEFMNSMLVSRENTLQRLAVLPLQEVNKYDKFILKINEKLHNLDLSDLSLSRVKYKAFLEYSNDNELSFREVHVFNVELLSKLSIIEREIGITEDLSKLKKMLSGDTMDIEKVSLEELHLFTEENRAELMSWVRSDMRTWQEKPTPYGGKF